jgi:hypothetical protein
MRPFTSKVPLFLRAAADSEYADDFVEDGQETAQTLMDVLPSDDLGAAEGEEETVDSQEIAREAENSFMSDGAWCSVVCCLCHSRPSPL